MKESKLVEMWNRVEVLGKNQQQIISEINNLRDLAVGTMGLVKKFPDYNDAIKKLTEDIKQQKDKKDVEQRVEKG